MTNKHNTLELSYHVAIRKKLIQRLSSFLYLYRDCDSLLLWQLAVIHLYLLDHLHLLINISAL